MDLVEFLMTGKLGPIYLGVNSIYIVDLLGDRDRTSLSSASQGKIYKYNDLQLHFWQEKLTSIVLQVNQDSIYLPNGFHQQTREPLRWISIYRILQQDCKMLDQEHVYNALTNTEQVCWISPGKVLIVADRHSNEIQQIGKYLYY